MSLLEQLRSSSRASAAPNTVETPEPAAVAAPRPSTPIEVLSAPVPAPPLEPPRTRVGVRSEALTDLKGRVHEELIHELDPDQLLNDVSFASPARRAVEQAAEERLGQIDSLLSRHERLRIASEIADEVLGFGPLEPLLRDPTITEVMVNAWNRVYFERSGIIHRAETTFRDDSHVLNIIDKILRPVSRRLDDSSPMVDARLPDGSRVNAVIPPLAVHGPSLTIRKFSRDLLAGEDLVRLGTLGRSTLDFLAACVRSRGNLLISGGTGTGKTTLLNLLSAYIPAHERIVTIEDPAELQVKHEDWVSLETRPSNIEGKGEILQRDLVRNALRMRPDRIIVGECRGGETLDMLQAMNTGHDGSMSTVHANTTRDALTRIENMVQMGNVGLPSRAIRQQIASAVDLIVQVERQRDGGRRVTQVTEICGMEGDVIILNDVFLLEIVGEDVNGKLIGRYKTSIARPHCQQRLAYFGLDRVWMAALGDEER